MKRTRRKEEHVPARAIWRVCSGTGKDKISRSLTTMQSSRSNLSSLLKTCSPWTLSSFTTKSLRCWLVTSFWITNRRMMMRWIQLNAMRTTSAASNTFKSGDRQTRRIVMANNRFRLSTYLLMLSTTWRRLIRTCRPWSMLSFLTSWGTLWTRYSTKTTDKSV